jgi:branched-subunit amino acid aminotransferase/4-amino-4-deoxychorismate lyase
VKAPGIQVIERTLSVNDLYEADEVFITSSTRDLLAVTEIDGRTLRRSGTAMAALKSAFQNYLAEYVRTHAPQAAGVR